MIKYICFVLFVILASSSLIAQGSKSGASYKITGKIYEKAQMVKFLFEELGIKFTEDITLSDAFLSVTIFARIYRFHMVKVKEKKGITPKIYIESLIY